MVTWYRRLVEVPGVAYVAGSEVNRSKLKGSNLTPEIVAYDFEGERHESLSWASRGGSTSASPAKEHSSTIDEEETSKGALKRLAEVLELPGEPSDYHFAIQSCADALRRRRRGDPSVLSELERLCWLDIRLVEACPTSVSFDSDGKVTYFAIMAFGYLVSLYAQEGLLQKAVEVAERGQRFNQGGLDLDALRARVARVAAEDAG